MKLSHPQALLALQIAASKLPTPEMEYRFTSELPPDSWWGKRRWRADLAWPALRIMVEVDGGLYIRGRHCRAAGIEGDMDKSNCATELGWEVYRFSPAMVTDGRAIATLRRALHGARS